MLTVDATQGDITGTEAEAIVVNLLEGVEDPGGATGAVDEALDGAISDLIATGDFAGERGETVLLYTNDQLEADRVVLVGLGERDELDEQAIRHAAGASVQALGKTEARSAATVVHGAGAGGLAPGQAGRAIAVGAISRAWSFDRKTEKDEEDEPELERLTLVEFDEGKLEAIEEGARRGSIVANAACFTRDVASFSGEEAAPAEIAATVEKAAAETGLACTVLGPESIEQERMGGVLAVSRGSEREPRFVILEWGPDDADASVCLCGKGVTFDTGGISLKSSKGMDKMRYDKGGAAAVFGTMLAVAKLELPVHVIGLTPLVENMPGGAAIKPGDVIKMRSGKTVDVLNTDAEGRLILADALDVAKEHELDHTVDLATLTGAVSTALGTQAAGLMGNDDALVDALEAAAEATDERVWRLPFYEEYGEQLEGGVGDVKNVGGRNAGCIVAGKFLEHFAPEEGWAHLDIAGVAWNDDKPYFNAGYTGEGATGAPVRLLVRWLEDLEG